MTVTASGFAGRVVRRVGLSDSNRPPPALGTRSLWVALSIVGLSAAGVVCACNGDAEGHEGQDVAVDTVGSDDSGSPDQGADVPSDGAAGGADALVADGGGDTSDESGDDCPRDRLAWGRGGELMLPGTDCQSCHTEGGSAVSVFTVSGTVFVGPDCPQPVAGATVDLVDGEGTEVAMVSNEEGNFFSAEPLAPPFHVSVTSGDTTVDMITAFQNGSCNSCHQEGSTLGFVWVAEP